jgi:Ca-activated chloride channel family protein
MSKALPQIRFLMSRPELVADRDQNVTVLIRITPPDAESFSGKRPLLNLSLVLDRSGSMEGAKIQRAREAAAYCIDQMTAADRVSLVIFDDEIEVLVPSQFVENRSFIKAHLERVHARNSTALHSAWVQGGLEVSGHLNRDAINRIILVTDGLANVGLTNTDEVVSQAAGLHERGVSTSTIGIGDDFNEDLLIPMARSAGGNSWHVERTDDLQSIFATELQGLIAQFAHRVSLGLIPADGVRVVDLLNDFELTDTGRYKLPNLQSGTPLDIVVQLKVPAQAVGSRLRLLDLKLGFTGQESGQTEVVKDFLEVGFRSEADVLSLPINAEVDRVNAMLMNARARKEAVRHMDHGDRLGARRVLHERIAATQLACAPMASAPEVVEELDSLSDLYSALESDRAGNSTRKRLAYGAFLRQQGKKK